MSPYVSGALLYLLLGGGISYGVHLRSLQSIRAERRQLPDPRAVAVTLLAGAVLWLPISAAIIGGGLLNVTLRVIGVMMIYASRGSTHKDESGGSHGNEEGGAG